MAQNASDPPMRATIEYDNGKTLMAQGPQALHDHVASRMEKALGKSLPQMEVRFRDVSISADIMVKNETDATVELPTLINVIKTAASSSPVRSRWCSASPDPASPRS
ncbi:ATP-binding Cassette (ABC) superfamily [Phytophthora infestans T30-4]|uniref:ATP-binding Cassette (ABC) superfamily n=1 Tax=Phytophthora infestans (strain T30-4) TaxID=403677 RepID=D0N216_PHYIT|nr:ATP-binding Cassette (ABC) superfamily [Phytophthora infestans T30-4]EEY68345.1 ATP-binding Cassette (ABC) superfamily [Phytophthora infestans T30-4]|eukprot:XP_002905504.1 ATP-binding Cassette (ABC) superfamily [Phytophthora infestans T30-4]